MAGAHARRSSARCTAAVALRARRVRSRRAGGQGPSRSRSASTRTIAVRRADGASSSRCSRALDAGAARDRRRRRRRADARPPTTTASADASVAVVRARAAAASPRSRSALAAALAARRRAVVLVDAARGRARGRGPPRARARAEPAQRGRRVSRTASATLDDCVVAVVDRGAGALGVVAGLPERGRRRTGHARATCSTSSTPCAAPRSVVVDDRRGRRRDRARVLAGAATAVVGVAGASPVGVVRALEWAADARRRVPGHAAAPRGEPRADASGSGARRSAPRSCGPSRPASLRSFPHDRARRGARRGTASSWRRGPFRTSVVASRSRVDAVAPGRAATRSRAGGARDDAPTRTT